MYAADRAEHVASVIAPGPGAGRDRHHRPVRRLLARLPGRRAGTCRSTRSPRFNWWATGGRTPDLTILLDMDPLAGLRRRARSADRLEAEPAGLPPAGPRRLPRAGPRRTRPLPGARRVPPAGGDHQRHPGPDPRHAARPGPAVAEANTGSFPAITEETGIERLFGDLAGAGRGGARPACSATAAAGPGGGGRAAGGRRPRRRRAGGRSPDPGAMTHAWLFTGPPGSGRSVAARAFAAALLCPSGGCGQCAVLPSGAGGHPRRPAADPARGAVLRGEADQGPGAARRGRAHRRAAGRSSCSKTPTGAPSRPRTRC